LRRERERREIEEIALRKSIEDAERVRMRRLLDEEERRAIEH
jgi:hypothetical protein